MCGFVAQKWVLPGDKGEQLLPGNSENQNRRKGTFLFFCFSFVFREEVLTF